MFIELKEKAGIYFLFSKLLREPPEEDLLKEIIKSDFLTGVWYFVVQEQEENQERDYFESDEWGTAGQIAIQFTSLFIAPGKKAIWPYGSFYCDALVIDSSSANSCYFPSESIREWGIKGIIGGPSVVKVNKIYREEGYKIDLESCKFPDHIACELEFVGRMHEEGKFNTARIFLKEFMNPWVFIFLAKVKSQVYSKFYRDVAFCLERFLKYECEDFLKTEDFLVEELKGRNESV